MRAVSSSASSMDSAPVASALPSAYAMPALVVPMASKPAVSSIRALPASHALGITNVPSSCRRRKRRPSSIWKSRFKVFPPGVARRSDVGIVRWRRPPRPVHRCRSACERPEASLRLRGGRVGRGAAFGTVARQRPGPQGEPPFLADSRSEGSGDGQGSACFASSREIGEENARQGAQAYLTQCPSTLGRAPQGTCAAFNAAG